MIFKNFSERQVVVRKVAVATGSQPLDEMIGHLSVLWNFRFAEAGDPEALLLAVEGAAKPLPGQSVIWLPRVQAEGTEKLLFPLRVEQLWQALENRFHQTPRRHIRLDTDIDAHITLANRSYAVTLQSISEKGCRIFFGHELVRQQELALAFEFYGQAYRLDSRVIYSIPGWGEKSDWFRTGLLFDRMGKGDGARLRDDLILCCLERVRENLEGKRFREALDYFSLPEVILEKLDV